MKYNELYDICLHRDDKWLDEIQLLSDGKSFLRLIMMYRYKTSDLSGDEWRASCGWQVHATFAELVQGDCDPWRRDSNWFSFDTGYNGGLETGCAALYPGIFSSQPKLSLINISAIDFIRKRRLLYRSTYDKNSLPLIHAAGHLPWALVKAKDEPLGTDEAWDDMQYLCFQVGCAEEAVSTYQLKARYERDGEKKEAFVPRYLEGEHAKAGLIRRFCSRHLQRGDCGLEDADKNYEVLEEGILTKELGKL